MSSRKLLLEMCRRCPAIYAVDVVHLDNKKSAAGHTGAQSIASPAQCYDELFYTEMLWRVINTVGNCRQRFAQVEI